MQRHLGPGHTQRQGPQSSRMTEKGPRTPAASVVASLILYVPRGLDPGFEVCLRGRCPLRYTLVAGTAPGQHTGTEV